MSQNSFKRIILPVDGSISSMNAAKKSIFLSKKLDIPLLSIYVVEKRRLLKFTSSTEYNRWKRETEEEAQKNLNRIEKLASERNVDVKTMVLHGAPSEEIIKQVNKNDLIVMGSKGHSSLDRILLGSVSETVIHHADSTVMIVK
ncbi:MAG: universal stress protein [Candidatus Thermoplasmatota archaeon]|nr:universal stress protein [Candidatus Thermoplasmatota archaeon]